MKIKFFFRWFEPKNEVADKDIWHKLNNLIYFGQVIGDKKYPQATHCGLVYDEDEFQCYVAESTNKGFVRNVYSKDWFKPCDKWRFISVDVKNYDFSKLNELIKSIEGTPYGFFDYFKFAFYFVFGKKFFK